MPETPEKVEEGERVPEKQEKGEEGKREFGKPLIRFRRFLHGYNQHLKHDVPRKKK